MSEYISKNMTADKCIALYAMLAILWSSVSLWRHTSKDGFQPLTFLLRALRLINFFVVGPLKAWILFHVGLFHLSLCQRLFGEIFEQVGSLDYTTRMVLKHWWVLLLIYFITGSKPLVGFLSFGVFMILQGIQLRRSLIKNEDAPTKRVPLPETLLFSILFILFVGTIGMAYYTKAYAASIRVATFLGVVALAILAVREPAPKTSKSNLQPPTRRAGPPPHMFPYRFRKKMWYDWILTVLVVLFLILFIIPIGYLSAFIYTTNLMPV